jgi:ATP-binding cassette subfamily C protein CydC
VLVIVFLSTILFTSFYSVYIALILLGGLLLTTFIVPAFFALRQRKTDLKVRKKRGELSTEVTELLHGFRDLKIYQQLDNKEVQLDKAAEAYVEEQQNEGMQHLFNESVNLMVSLIVTWFVLGAGAYLVTAGKLDGIFLAMFVMISLTVFEDAAPMAAFPNHLQANRQAAGRLFSVVRDGRRERTAQIAQELPAASPDIVLDQVSFSFSEELRTTIQSASLSLPAGSKTAIVGPSGSGKSTLLQLLLKTVSPDKGEIRMHGIPTDKISGEQIWERANVVLQKNHFFYGTIRDNLAIAKNGLTDEVMKEMLSIVKLGHFSLEDRVLEKGENLSGGEKQRLAIARAMLRNKSLWVLDEPTSSVDAVTEDHIYRTLFRQAAEDTLVLVSHRLTGIEKMDQIIVMEQGKIIETGTYTELMNQKGYFYSLKKLEQSVF